MAIIFAGCASPDGTATEQPALALTESVKTGAFSASHRSGAGVYLSSVYSPAGATDGALSPACENTASCGSLVVGMAAGDFHTCAVFADGTVKCWGYNDQGQLGQGDTIERGRGTGLQPDMGSALEVVSLGNEVRVESLAAGTGHTCALLHDGRVKCWGGNDRGQLGQGDLIRRGTGAFDDPGMGDALAPVDLGVGRTAVAVTAGENHNCALLDNGQVKCWGSNDYGQLGQGDRRSRGTGWEDDAGMGDALPAVDLGDASNGSASATAIAAGAMHSCALLEDGTVKCWGWNLFGQLGTGDNIDRGTGLPDDLGLGDGLPAISFGQGRRATSITAGYAHTCALLDDQTIRCWGRNRYGQLGYDDTVDRNQPVAGEAGSILSSEAAVGIVAAVGYHTCALLESGRAKCWGSNRYGQLGQGDTLAWGADTGLGGVRALAPIDLGADQDVVGISAGLLHTCFMMIDHSVKCCGSNTVGQLGYSDPFDRCNGDSAFPMGNLLAAVPVH